VGIQIFQILGTLEILEWALCLWRFSFGCGRFFPFQLKTICQDVSLNLNLEAKYKKGHYLHLLSDFLAGRVLQLVQLIKLESHCNANETLKNVMQLRFKCSDIRCLHWLSFSTIKSTSFTSLYLFLWFSLIFSGSPPLSARNRSMSRTIF
jgi:hypothetical protein